MLRYRQSARKRFSWRGASSPGSHGAKWFYLLLPFIPATGLRFERLPRSGGVSTSGSETIRCSLTCIQYTAKAALKIPGATAITPG